MLIPVTVTLTCNKHLAYSADMRLQPFLPHAARRHHSLPCVRHAYILFVCVGTAVRCA